MQEELLPGLLKHVQAKKTDRVKVLEAATGTGKSLLYLLPALGAVDRNTEDKLSTTVVVAPLAALIRSQMDGALRIFETCGIRKDVASSLVAAFWSDQTKEERRDANRAVDNGSAAIVFVTPERIAQPWFAAQLKNRLSIDVVLIDEVHLLCSWSTFFRDSYQQVNQYLSPASRDMSGSFWVLF